MREHQAEIRRRLILQAEAFEPDRTVPYGQGSALAVPREPGIYLIHDLRGVLYIGQSDNLRRRFDQHFFEVENPLLAAALGRAIGPLSFSWKELPRTELASAERELIRAFQPACNRLLYSTHN